MWELTFLRKKGKSGAAVGKLVLLQAEEREQISVEEQAKLLMELIDARKKFFAAKRAEEQRNKPPTKAEQRKRMCTYMKHMAGYKDKDFKGMNFDAVKKMFDKVYKHVNDFVSKDTKSSRKKDGSINKRDGEELVKESSKKQKMDEDIERAELKGLMKVIANEEGIAIDAIPLATKSPSIVD
ncbi:hypothetical protein Tco_0232164 [Tanacetum coccineum]